MQSQTTYNQLSVSKVADVNSIKHLADSDEPARTERLLSRKCSTCPMRCGDLRTALVGRSYWLLLVALNTLIGILCGLEPLLAAGSAHATAQASSVFILQLTMLGTRCRVGCLSEPERRRLERQIGEAPCLVPKDMCHQAPTWKGAKDQ
jgi:hypothetical protein